MRNVPPGIQTMSCSTCAGDTDSIIALIRDCSGTRTAFRMGPWCTRPEPSGVDSLSRPIIRVSPGLKERPWQLWGTSTSHRYEVRPTSDSHFSWLRTRMSAERTLMSWLRTAVSMIGFGFTIVQFFEHFHEMAGVKIAAHPEAPRYLGMMLIGAGTIALLVAVWQY